MCPTWPFNKNRVNLTNTNETLNLIMANMLWNRKKVRGAKTTYTCMAIAERHKHAAHVAPHLYYEEWTARKTTYRVFAL